MGFDGSNAGKHRRGAHTIELLDFLRHRLVRLLDPLVLSEQVVYLERLLT